MTPELIFDGSHLRAVLRPGTKNRLMVTFDYRMDGKAGFSPDNHSTQFARMGLAQLSIKTSTNDWFINPDTTALEQVLSRLAPAYSNVQLLGFSMGAYGALRFAKALQARTLIAVSPQLSIHPAVVPFERRYLAEGLGFDPGLGDLRSQAMPGLRGLILIDPFVSADRAHAALIQKLFAALQIVRLNFGGHPAFGVVRDAGKGWTVHHAAAAADPKPGLIIAAHRDGRRHSSAYWRRLAQSAAAVHPALAAIADQKAGQLDQGPEMPPDRA